MSWGLILWSDLILFLVYLCQLYLLILILRAALSWVQAFVPDWRPSSRVGLFVTNFLYAVTDPPLNLIGRYVRPLRFGGLGIDLSFIILFLLVGVIQRYLPQLIWLGFWWSGI